jgi:hypothetical protein
VFDAPKTLEQQLIDSTACEIQDAIPIAKRRSIYPTFKQLHFDLSLPSINSLDYKNNLTGNEQPFFTLPCENFVGLSDADAALAGITKSNLKFTNNLGGSVFDGSDGSIANYCLIHGINVPDNTRNCLATFLTPTIVLNISWTDALTDVTTRTYGGFTDWRLPDLVEMFYLVYADSNSIRLFNYAPLNRFGVGAFDRAWWTRERTGTTSLNNVWTGQDAVGGIINVTSATTSTRIYFPVRKHTY